MCTEFENTVLSAKEIVKSFGGLVVLKHISINIKKGRVLALVGENGAGKSTLINILSGSLQADSGELYYEGKEIAWATPKKALQNGIAVVHQELTLFHNLPVYENVFAGNSATTRGMRLDRATMRAESGHTSSNTVNPFSRSVDPVSTISTMTSESPTIGASSSC